MDSRDYWLAVIPPALAIVIEFLDPCNEAYFASHASRIVQQKIGTVTGQCAQQVEQARGIAEIALKTSMAGVASIEGLAPTIVSFFMSGIAIIFSFEKPFFWVIGLLVICVVMVLSVLRTHAGKTVFDLDANPIVVYNRAIIRPTRLFSLLIYLTNAVLIVGFSCIYFKWPG